MTTLTIATGFAALSALLLLVLASIWIRNYRTFRTPMILGLVVFAVVLLLENATAIYFFFSSMKMLYVNDPAVLTSVAILRGLQFLALCFLTWATLQ
ncbi:hypothetical protein [Halovivax limisalsi]|uniref:hypothetical protein n=1 Tax=Halovivax limisalsi TaxID=1453760 RepID=UPI001FFD0412|nr:hypothetical protein [Halovivax limisalsi]